MEDKLRNHNHNKITNDEILNYNNEDTNNHNLNSHSHNIEGRHNHAFDANGSIDGDNHQHSHNHTAHGHVHKNTKVVLDRLSRASGHLESVKRMIADGKDCSEVLIQLSAVIAALNNTGKVILKDHIENCIVEAVESGNQSAIDQLNEAIDRFIK